MTGLTQALEQHVIKSLPEYTTIVGLLLVAFIANLTPPAVVDKWLGAWQPVANYDRKWMRFFALSAQKMRDLLSILYTLFYNTLQAFMAAKNPHPPNPTTPQPGPNQK